MSCPSEASIPLISLYLWGGAILTVCLHTFTFFLLGKISMSVETYQLIFVSFIPRPHFIPVSVSHMSNPVSLRSINSSENFSLKYRRIFSILWAFSRYNYLYDLWNPKVQCRIHKGSPIIPILSRINPIPRMDTHIFKIHFNIVLPSTTRPSKRHIYCWFN